MWTFTISSPAPKGPRASSTGSQEWKGTTAIRKATASISSARMAVCRGAGTPRASSSDRPSGVSAPDCQPGNPSSTTAATSGSEPASR